MRGYAPRSRHCGPKGGSMRDVLPIGPSEFVRPFCGPILTGFPAYEPEVPAVNDSRSLLH